jgi:hypothetical protein
MIFLLLMHLDLHSVGRFVGWIGHTGTGDG